MKKRNLLSGFALSALMTLGMVGAAHAANYDCNDQVNHPIPTVYNNGDVLVSGTNCIVNHSITVTNGYRINFTISGTLTTEALTADGDVQTSSSGNLTINGDVQSNYGNTFLGTTAGNMKLKNVTAAAGAYISGHGKIETQNIKAMSDYLLIFSTGDDAAGGRDIIVTGSLEEHYQHTDVEALGGNISISGTSTGDNARQIFIAAKDVTIGGVTNQNGDVRVFAHQDGVGTTPLTIGTGGVGSIINDGMYGFGIYISSPTGITYNADKKLSVNGVSGPTGQIILDGGATGTVSLSGTITIDDTNGSGSGGFVVLAPTIVANGMTLNANAPSHTVGDIQLVTDQLTNSGSFTVNMNGNGSAGYINFAVYPVGTHAIAYPPFNIDVGVAFTDYQPSTDHLTISGTGQFTINADGNDNSLEILGYPLTINSPLTVNQKGSGDSTVISGTDQAGNFTTVTLGAAVAIHERNTASGQAPNAIRIDGTRITQPAAANVLLDASGYTGSGANGGNIDLTPSDGTLKLGGIGAGTVTLNANGSTTGGKGGTINAGFGNTLALILKSGDAISASAIGGDDDGGTIDLEASTISTDTGIAKITADSHGGHAGNITLNHQSGDVDMNLDSATISASGDDTGNASGNAITIQSNFGITFNATSLMAVGHGTGDGGNIQVISPNVVDLKLGLLLAHGGDNGAGGNAIVSSVSEFDVNTHINVDAGSGTIGNTSKFAGIIQLNSVECRQYHTGYDWPQAFWDCTPGGLSDVDQAAPDIATGLTNLKSSFASQPTQLYVFEDASHFNLFFDGDSPVTAGGFTFKELRSTIATDSLYVTVFENGNKGDDANHQYTVDEFKEVAAHELGHGTDVLFGILSTQATYQAYFYRDLRNLDFVLDTTVTPNVSRRRLPCANTPLSTGFSSDTPPFQNVVNVSTGNPVCVTDASGNKVLNPAEFSLTPYTSNSWVLQQIEGGLYGSAHWPEVHAQTFGYEHAGVLGARPMNDGVYANSAPSLLLGSYFGCVKEWAHAEISGIASPATTPDSCGTLEAGYTPFQH